MVFASTTGGTAQMVDAAVMGAQQADQDQAVSVLVRLARDATAQDVLDAQGLLWATPEHLGSMAGLMKDFFDRTYYTCIDRVVGRPYALMVCAGSDGQGTMRQVARICTGWRLRQMADPLLVLTHAQSADQILAPKHIAQAERERCSQLGATLAAGLAAGLYG